MKFSASVLTLCASIIMIGTSCKKENHDGRHDNGHTPRNVQFQLYSEPGYTDTDSVFFKVVIQKATGQFLWDSTLAPMEIKDIPNQEHKISILKSVPGNDATQVKVGFYYTIKSIGSSWHLEALNVGETFKLVDFNF